MAQETWADRERRTARLVRACYDRYLAESRPSAEQLHALCKLTWITISNGYAADATKAVVAPALSAITREKITAANRRQLRALLVHLKAPVEVVREASKPVGMVNFYGAFRNTSIAWMKQHRAAVWWLFQVVATAQSDDDIHDAYVRVDRLPPLPRRRGGHMAASSLLTPTLACLDPRGRAPIINARKSVRVKLKRLGLSNGTLVEQCRGLMGLIRQEGITDAFDLDDADPDDLIYRFTRPKRRNPRPRKAKLSLRPLVEGSDEDIEYIQRAKTVVARRLHNRMTTALKHICDAMGLATRQGTTADCMFDTLVEEYLADERSLLIEVKTDGSPPFARMAVGQLLDYRRHLPDRAGADIAVLFPAEPGREVLAFLGDIGVLALWFVDGYERIVGDVEFDPG